MAYSAGPHDILAAAEARRATEKGNSVARPRWQRGWLFKRGKKNPVWVCRFREDAISENGLRIRRQRSIVLGPVRELSKREALSRVSDRLAQINQGRHKPELLSTFERFVLERWEPNILPMLRFSTARNYRHMIRRHLIPFFGQVRLPEIGSADVQIFLAEKSKRYSPKTLLSLRNLLSKIFGTAQKWGYLQANPAQGTQVPAQVATRERLTRTPEQVRALLGVLAEPFRTMVLLAVLSGLRRGEIFGLRWKSVDWLEGSIIVTEADYEGHSAPPKTRASCRKVFVDVTVIESLERLRPEIFQPDDLIFHTDRGTPFNPNNVMNRVLAPACKEAGVPHVSWHNFRYTFSTWANPSGESIKALQSQLGHTDSRLTLSVYTQPMPEPQNLLAGKVARVLLPVAPKLVNANQSKDALLN
jgi:integrase